MPPEPLPGRALPKDGFNQAEMERLLSALDAGAIARIAPAPPEPQAAQPPPRPARTGDKVWRYDFKRPGCLGNRQMRFLEALHETFARDFGTALSALLRSVVEMKLSIVDQLSYSEFMLGLDDPTCLNVLKADPLEGNLLLDIHPSIVYPIIDRLLGGGRESGPPTRRALTQIELRLVRRITGLFLDELHRAWKHLLHLDLSVVRVETNPQRVQVLPANEPVVVLSFELTLGEACGTLKLCLPFSSIQPIASKLSGDSAVADRNSVADESSATEAPSQATPESIRQISRNLHHSLVEVVVRLADTQISTTDLVGLQVGDIITTQKDIGSPLSVEIEGVTKFHARPGAYKGRKAIRIEEKSQR